MKMTIVALTVTAAAMGAIGLSYTHCVQAQEPTWRDGGDYVHKALPILVNSTLPRTYKESVAAAMKLWDKAAGCSLFARGIGPVSIRQGAIEVDDNMTHNHIAGTYRRGNKFEIIYRRPGDTNEAYLTIAHELGHVLALAHDRHPGTIMHWNIVETGHDKLVFVSSKDRAALRARYCVALGAQRR